jgi:hypothetical protein
MERKSTLSLFLHALLLLAVIARHSLATLGPIDQHAAPALVGQASRRDCRLPLGQQLAHLLGTAVTLRQESGRDL